MITSFIVALISLFVCLNAIDLTSSISINFKIIRPNNFKKKLFFNPIAEIPIIIAFIFIAMYTLFNRQINNYEINLVLIILCIGLLLKAICKIYISRNDTEIRIIDLIYFLLCIFITIVTGILIGSLVEDYLSISLISILIELLTIAISLFIGGTVQRYINISSSNGLNTLIHESLLFLTLFTLLIPSTLLIGNINILLDPIVNIFSLIILLLSLFIAFSLDLKKEYRYAYIPTIAITSIILSFILSTNLQFFISFILSTILISLALITYLKSTGE